MYQKRIQSFLLTILLCIIENSESLPPGKNNTSTRLIINGESAEIGLFPYHLYVKHRVLWCGGSLYNANTAITAAHCVGDNMHVLGGGIGYNDGERRDVCEIIKHPNNLDFAILKLCEPFQFNHNIQPIELFEDDPTEYEMGLVMGFGENELREKAQKRHLKFGMVKIMPQDMCLWPENDFRHGTFCAKMGPNEENICFGDSGGPLVIDGKLAGVLSWLNTLECNDISGYVNVPMLKDFIEENAY